MNDYARLHKLAHRELVNGQFKEILLKLADRSNICIFTGMLRATSDYHTMMEQSNLYTVAEVEAFEKGKLSRARTKLQGAEDEYQYHALRLKKLVRTEYKHIKDNSILRLIIFVRARLEYDKKRRTNMYAHLTELQNFFEAGDEDIVKYVNDGELMHDSHKESFLIKLKDWRKLYAA
jgi:hypothetical protein